MLREELGYVFRNKPIVLANGDWILGVECDDEHSRFLILEDGGQRWFYSAPVPGVMHSHPTLIQRSDGSLFALLRPLTQQDNPPPGALPRIGRTQSFDNGRTWTQAVYTDLPNHGAAFDMVKLRDGRVVMAFNNSETDRSRLTLAMSYDEGETWPVMRDLEPPTDGGQSTATAGTTATGQSPTPPGSFEYPAIIQDGAGLLHVTYSVGPELWNRDRIKHVCLSPEWVEEVTGGQ